ncbi:ribosomal protein S6 kinase-related protein isoform X8 [Chionomys nivalis]|uniref:ribosomal protein S6 kinase-related protein isoform X8 n=1 Tax=Chionomys nivalis TaxID=269649 RepID=UPI002594A052|nr:ribosomal protein S6 kinase-related protein isoform X8 [Chionomys nivalis]
MGTVSCRQGQHTRVSAPQKQGGNIQGPWARGWKSLFCGMGAIRSGVEELRGLQRHQCLHQELLQPVPLQLEKPLSEWPVPQFISLFLPEFPMRPVRGQQTLQRQINHPFVHSLGDSWQGKRHLFIMCSYCSMDLYSLWSAVGGFPEASIRLFAAELVLVLCYLHDLGIIHRDVKMENILLDERGHLKLTDFGLSRRLSQGARAYTICGTLQYMAPEVLSGGPYNHTADWWSLGVLLFCLATGKFPVAAERDHVAMLASVTHCKSEMPASATQEFSLLLHELLCQNPLHRLRHLHHFQGHPFFRGVAFDPELLKKQPVDLVMETQNTSPLETMPFKDFDCDLESLVHTISADSLL